MSREILHLKKKAPAPKLGSSDAINQHKRMAMGLPITQGSAEKGKKVKK